MKQSPAPRRFLAILPLTFLAFPPLVALGCAPAPTAGGDAGTTVQPATKSVRVDQKPLAAADWQKELDGDAALAAVAKAAGGSFQVAGSFADDHGGRVVWAEYAPSPEADRTQAVGVLRACDGDKKCTVAKATYTATGADFSDQDGKPIAALAVAVPALAKQLKGHSVDQDPVILAPLKREHIVEIPVQKGLFAQVAFKQRRCVVLNAFGKAIGAGAETVVQAAQKTGLFDAVETVEYARKADFERYLRVLTPLDVLVVLAPGVQEVFTGGSPSKAIGVTLSRGVVGDQFVHRNHVSGLLDAPPLGGAGLVMLAGGRTAIEATLNDSKAFAYQLSAPPVRAVVALAGKPTWAQAQAAAAALLADLGAGKDLETALGSATKAAAGVKALAPMDKSFRQAWKVPGKSLSFWQKPPSKSDLKLFVKVEPQCVTGAGTCDKTGYNSAYQQPGNRVATTDLSDGDARFYCNPTFQGPWFTCSGKDANSGMDFTLSGVMRGREVGDRFWLWLEGTGSKAFQNTAIVGEGQFEKVDPAGGSTEMYFRGPAAAAPYQDDKGRCCLAKSPLLQGLKSEPGQFKLYN
jgi:hypothetical protein